MRLQPDKFNRHLAHLGQNFSLKRASACPCINPDTSAPNADCLQCHGIGWVWGAAVTGISGIAAQKIQREWANFGLWQAGDVVLTIPSDSLLYAMGPYDRVTMLDSTEAFSFIRYRGVDDLKPAAWASVERVYWLDGSEAVVEGGIPTFANGILTWATGEPANGQQYSITGRKHPEFYMLQDLAQDRAHHQGLALPRRVVLRKLDFLSRG